MLSSYDVGKMGLDERCLRGTIRYGGLPSGYPAWDAASSWYEELLWYLLNWPNNTSTTPPLRVICGLTQTAIANAMGTLTGIDRTGGQSDLDYLAATLVADDLGS